MHIYRTHTCGELRKEHAGEEVKLSGWIFRKRDHGSLLFFDLRDNYGVTQIVIEPEKDFFELSQKIHIESVVTIVGKVEPREGSLVNNKLPTGEVEVVAQSIIVESAAEVLPLYIAGQTDESEDLRLKYRFLDLRRERLHNNIILRSDIVSEIRKIMTQTHNFKEFETPILTSSSPEGARDFLVPSRLHPGKFYALPQSPQQYKQLLMLAGFDKYFQIAPCFRDEDARADRSPGVHYQLDMEMSFVTQDEVFAIVENIIRSCNSC
jgi:aspartyl-tRNA synthetase